MDTTNPGFVTFVIGCTHLSVAEKVRDAAQSRTGRGREAMLYTFGFRRRPVSD